MQMWELVARERIRDCIAPWNDNGDARHMDQMVLVLAPVEPEGWAAALS